MLKLFCVDLKLVFIAFVILCTACTNDQNKHAQSTIKIIPPPYHKVESKVDAASLSPAELLGRCVLLEYQSHFDLPVLLNSLDNNIGGAILFKGDLAELNTLKDSLKSYSYPPLIIWDSDKAFKSDSSKIIWPKLQLADFLRDTILHYDFLNQYAIANYNVGVNAITGPVLSVDNINRFEVGVEDKIKSESRFVNAIHQARVLSMADGIGDYYEDMGIVLNSEDSVSITRKKMWLSGYQNLIDNGLGIWRINSDILFPPTADGLAEYRPGRVGKEIIRNELGYSGILWTSFNPIKKSEDDLDELLEKQAARIVRGLLNGIDGFLIQGDPIALFEKIDKAYSESESDGLPLIQSADKWYKAAAWQGHDKVKPKIMTERALLKLIDDCLASSVILSSDKYNQVPILGNSKKIASLAIGPKQSTEFQKQLSKFCEVSQFVIPNSELSHAVPAYLKMLSSFDLIIISLYDNPPIRTSVLLDELITNQKVILIDFISSNYKSNEEAAILHIPDLSDRIEIIAADAIFGARSISGFSAIEKNALGKGEGIIRNKEIRITTGWPEQVGLHPDSLAKVDSLIEELIRLKGTPGAQVAIGLNNKIIYNKSYGYHTRRQVRPVLNEDVYDLASITKVAATTFLVMKYVDRGLLSTSSKVGELIPESKGKPIENITVKQLLTHTSGLPASLPISDFISPKRRTKKGLSALLNSNKTEKYSVKIARGKYLDQAIPASVKQLALEAKPGNSGQVLYSDLGFLILGMITESVSGKNLAIQFEVEIAKPLHLSTTCFLPAQSEMAIDVVPSADKDFRNTRLQGYVHDPLAALCGGAAGHAGLFSNAFDLVVLGQILQNEGEYAGELLLTQEVIKEFTVKSGLRHLGFSNSPYSNFGSGIGHTGFTGTCIWLDPEKKLTLVFLSNRLQMNNTNAILADIQTRERIWRHLQACIN